MGRSAVSEVGEVSLTLSAHLLRKPVCYERDAFVYV